MRAGRVYTRSSNGWLSLDSTTGRHIFERDLGVLVTTAPSVIDGQLIVATGDGYVRSYIPDDGELSWRAWLGAQLVSPPVGAGDYLMCVADNGCCMRCPLEMDRSLGEGGFMVAPTEARLWERGAKLLWLSGSGEMTGFDPMSGDVRWSVRVGSEKGIRVYATESGLWVLADDGHAHVFDP